MHFLFDLLIASAAFLIVVVTHFLSQKIMKLENNKSFLYLVAVGFLNLILGITSTILVYRGGAAASLWTEISVTALLLMDVTAYHAMLFYLAGQFVPGKTDKYWLIPAIIVLPAVVEMGILTNHWTGAFFTLTEGTYHIGSRYGIMYAYAAIELVAMLVCATEHAEELGPQKVSAVWEVAALMTLSLVFRATSSRANTELLSGYTMALGITVLFLTLNNPYRCTDGLTSAFDLHFFRDRVKDHLARNRKFHILAVNLNQLKHINFVMGTEVGNQVLTAAAGALMESGKKNMVFRISGKRFMVMCHTEGDLKAATDRAMQFFSTSFEVGEDYLEPHAVLCTFRDAQELGSVSSILAYSGFLARQAKWPFETCLIESNPKLLEGFHYNQEVEGFMETAMEQDMFDVVFQPVYNLDQKRYTTMEVLSRLNHPRLGPVSPAVFIDIAEKNDQIARIALLQLRKVCEFLTRNPEIQQQFQSVKINVSPIELLKPGHIEKMLRMIREYDIPLSFFQFEITESTAIEYDQALDNIVTKFSELGIGLCLDDFGSGYANLNAVVKLPFHTIKLDRSLLFGICQDPKVAGLYQSLVVSLHNMGFVVLAEGVETDEELNLVSQWGVDLIQGFYFSKPLKGHVLVENLQNAC